MTTAALILTGGESSRFGGQPKALLRAGERSAVRRLAEVSLAQGLDPVVVVVGAHRLPISLELRGLGVEIAEAADWYEGRTASVQAGLRALPVDRDILFWPIDHPFVSPRTVQVLTSLLDRDPLGVWFIPTYQGHGGHPVAWRSVLRRDLLELRPDAPIRALLPEFGPQVRRLPVDDPGVIANVDTPEAYRAAHEDWLSRAEE
jgi:molybdenum cofactor cytidylyltransferase